MNQLSSFAPSQARPRQRHGSQDSAAELYALIQELSRTALRLQEYEAAEPSAHLTHQPHQLESSGLIAAKVRRQLLDRARRNKIFPAELFADPAWDILLNLYSSHLDQQRETITGIICLAGVPATTGLRWVHKLVEDGLLILRDDPLDQRRKWVHLSTTALAALQAYFTPEQQTHVASV